MSAGLTVIGTATPPRVSEVRAALRTLVESADRRRRAPRGSLPGDLPEGADGDRTWAVIGELLTDPPSAEENQRAVDHDQVGRLAVRLAVDKVLCVGSSRSVRALYQGTVMEGSWGDEARVVDSVGEAIDVLVADPEWSPRPGDTVVVAVPGLSAETVANRWREQTGHEVTVRPADAGIAGTHE